MKIYVATGLENAPKARELMEMLRAAGHTITYDWAEHGPVWREGSARLREVGMAELAGVTQADAVIALLPGGRGTHTEIGAALASGKPVLLWAEHGSAEHGTLQPTNSTTCAFYYHPLVYRTTVAFGLLMAELAVGPGFGDNFARFALRAYANQLRVFGRSREAALDHGITLNQWRDLIHAWAVSKGWAHEQLTDADLTCIKEIVTEKLLLMHTEISEATEDLRLIPSVAFLNDPNGVVAELSNTKRFDGKGKPIGFASELIDTIIRALQLCGMLGIDVDAGMAAKMAYNDGRPFMHGKSM